MSNMTSCTSPIGLDLYLQLSGGEPSHNLLKLVREELRLSLRTALYQAVQDGINVDVHGLEVTTDEGLKTINLMVRPVLREEDPTRGYILVIFEEADNEELSQSFATPGQVPRTDFNPTRTGIDSSQRAIANHRRAIRGAAGRAARFERRTADHE